jgi:hypothetical protein
MPPGRGGKSLVTIRVLSIPAERIGWNRALRGGWRLAPAQDRSA